MGENDGQFIRDWPGHGCFGGNHSGWSFTGPDFRCKNSCHTGLGYHADEIYKNTVYKHVAQDKSEEPHMCAELIQHAVFFQLSRWSLLTPLPGSRIRDASRCLAAMTMRKGRFTLK